MSLFVVHIFDQLHTGLSIKIECLRTKVSNLRRCSNMKQREKSTAFTVKQRHHAINDLGIHQTMDQIYKDTKP
jgi:hypothetical protein